MNFKSTIVVGLMAISAGPSIAVAQNAAAPTHEGPSVSTPAPNIKFVGSGVRTEKGELFAGPAYGNLQQGRHGTFIRMPHGFVSPVHTHTEDYYGVVIKGVGANQMPNGKIVPLPVGSYWFQKGEEPHVTQCLSKTDCLFFIVQPGKFDYVPTK
jgi:beta-alanine degradation protein BauB